MDPNSTSSNAIMHKAYARVGFLGNPSDVYNGKSISFSLGNFWASVKLVPSDQIVIQPHPIHDFVQFGSLQDMVRRVNSEGYHGGMRLLMAICSSAIVTAAFNCLLDFYKVRHLIKVEVRPNLVLAAEKELGIVAGLQDRVAQTYGGLVYMDFSKEHMDNMGHGIYTPMDLSLLPPLYLIYAENPSDSGKVHSKVRQRWLEGDEFIISSMAKVANLAEEGKTVLEEKDYSKLAELMNQNFDLRRSMFGDDALGDMNIKMVEIARKVGASSKFTGSGGAIVAFCPDGPSQVKLLEDECRKAGFVIQAAELVPSLLTEIDKSNLSTK